MRAAIEAAFQKQVRKDDRVKNAYLLVQSDKLNLDLNTAEGTTGSTPAVPGQPNHLASVGKLFTATLIGILHERGLLDFDDRIGKYLDSDLMNNLHIHKGRDHSSEILIRHLLKQTSGLNDVFHPLLKRLVEEPGFEITPRAAVEWGKEHLKPVAAPGKKHHYTDTNYYLLGLIIESITGKQFHEAMHEHIFAPLGMKHACMYGFSEAQQDSGYPPAALYIDGVDLLSIDNIHQIDYAGGSVLAPLDEFLIFMRSLVNSSIIKRSTLERMLQDDIPMGFPMMGFSYGYSIWKTRTIPLLAPEKYYCWGCVGITGAFMFYHPATDSCIIGTFNDSAYRAKALQFMIGEVIKTLLKG
ncbi:serine hydrolase [bacterium]|nr:serine hydrolase [bacterium]